MPCATVTRLQVASLAFYTQICPVTAWSLPLWAAIVSLGEGEIP